MNFEDIKFKGATVIAALGLMYAAWDRIKDEDQQQDEQLVQPVVKQLTVIGQKLGRQISQTTAPNIVTLNDMICNPNGRTSDEIAALKRSRASLEAEYLREAGRDFYEFAQVKRCP